MSAFVVNKEHIDVLVLLALRGPAGRGPRYPGDGWSALRWYEGNFETGEIEGRAVNLENLNEVGAMLLRECIASVGYRYQDTLWPELPGPVPNPDPHEYRGDLHQRRPTLVAGLKLIDCYEYQSCEHPGWHSSSARSFCEALRKRLIGALPGYPDAPYEWPPRDPLDVRV
jgi:hypothetical protein